MIKITFIDHSSVRRDVEVVEGLSVMEAAVQNLIPGIDGDCGGCCACGTCHIHVNPEFLDRLPPMGEVENEMLGLVGTRDEYSRLGCQVKASQALDGLVVHTPLGQH